MTEIILKTELPSIVWYGTSLPLILKRAWEEKLLVACRSCLNICIAALQKPCGFHITSLWSLWVPTYLGYHGFLFSQHIRRLNSIMGCMERNAPQRRIVPRFIWILDFRRCRGEVGNVRRHECQCWWCNYIYFANKRNRDFKWLSPGMDGLKDETAKIGFEAISNWKKIVNDSTRSRGFVDFFWRRIK